MIFEKDSLRLMITELGVATLTLTQGSRGNPIDGQFCRDFRDAMTELATLEGIRVLLIKAEGKNYSVGGDVKRFAQEVENLPKLILEWTADLHMGLSRFWGLPFPVVVQVHGMAMGGSVAVLAGADLVVAGETAKFGSAFTKLGFSCDSGTSITLSMRMGLARARRFVMLGEVLSAGGAKSAGLVDEIVPDDRLQARVDELVASLACGPTKAYGEIRRLFLQAGSLELERQLEDEAQTLARIGGSEDAKSAIKSFITREPVTFSGM